MAVPQPSRTGLLPRLVCETPNPDWTRNCWREACPRSWRCGGSGKSAALRPQGSSAESAGKPRTRGSGLVRECSELADGDAVAVPQSSRTGPPPRWLCETPKSRLDTKTVGARLAREAGDVECQVNLLRCVHKDQARSLRANPEPVGADLSANAVDQPMEMQWLYLSLRGQVRSHV